MAAAALHAEPGIESAAVDDGVGGWAEVAVNGVVLAGVGEPVLSRAFGPYSAMPWPGVQSIPRSSRAETWSGARVPRRWAERCRDSHTVRSVPSMMVPVGGPQVAVLAVVAAGGP